MEVWFPLNNMPIRAENTPGWHQACSYHDFGVIFLYRLGLFQKTVFFTFLIVFHRPQWSILEVHEKITSLYFWIFKPFKKWCNRCISLTLSLTCQNSKVLSQVLQTWNLTKYRSKCRTEVTIWKFGSIFTSVRPILKGKILKKWNSLVFVGELAKSKQILLVLY